jgi:N utilization substance protein B
VKKDRRRRARETALQILYQWEVGKIDVGRAADIVLGPQWPDVQAPPDDLREFATALAVETVGRIEAIDALIAETSERWRPERMAIVDRLVLRLAVCELLRDATTPAPVVINEAIELGRTFSTEESAPFINGMLDGVRKKLDR